METVFQVSQQRISDEAQSGEPLSTILKKLATMPTDGLEELIDMSASALTSNGNPLNWARLA
jgi:hypothetical protein